jgi:hypothetical protein
LNHTKPEDSKEERSLKNILATILVVVSLLMIDARAGFCRETVTAWPQQAEESSAQQKSQGAQNPGATTSSSAGQTQPARLDDKARKIKHMVEKIGVAGRLTLYLKNGEELYGSVVRYDEESLQVAEIDLQQVVTVQYRNVKKVREDYGKPNPFTGKRNSPAKGIKIGIAIGVLFLAIGLPIIGLASSKD